MPKLMGLNANYFRSEVVRYLKKIEISKAVISSEKKLESNVFKQLIAKFPIIDTQKVVESSNGLKIDIDLGTSEVGIELKLASQLLKSASERQRLSGQIKRYKKTYGSDIIVLVVGKNSDEGSALLREVKADVKSEGAYYLYKSVK